MSRERYPVTPAIRALRAAGVSFDVHEYPYVEHGGTSHSASTLGVDEHRVIKTLVMSTDAGSGLLVLMHGDREVSTQKLARTVGARDVSPVSPERASALTGYLVGGTSPFGTRRVLPVYVEATILALDEILINGGKRGLLVRMAPRDIGRVVALREVSVARERSGAS